MYIFFIFIHSFIYFPQRKNSSRIERTNGWTNEISIYRKNSLINFICTSVFALQWLRESVCRVYEHDFHWQITSVRQNRQSNTIASNEFDSTDRTTNCIYRFGLRFMFRSMIFNLKRNKLNDFIRIEIEEKRKIGGNKLLDTWVWNIEWFSTAILRFACGPAIHDHDRRTLMNKTASACHICVYDDRRLNWIVKMCSCPYSIWHRRICEIIIEPLQTIAREWAKENETVDTVLSIGSAL